MEAEPIIQRWYQVTRFNARIYFIQCSCSLSVALSLRWSGLIENSSAKKTNYSESVRVTFVSPLLTTQCSMNECRMQKSLTARFVVTVTPDQWFFNVHYSHAACIWLWSLISQISKYKNKPPQLFTCHPVCMLVAQPVGSWAYASFTTMTIVIIKYSDERRNLHCP